MKSLDEYSEMFESLADNIQTEVADLFANGSFDENNPEDIERLQVLVNRNFLVLKELVASLHLDLPLYRARYDSGFDETDITQFGYIHDASRVKRFRYNIDKEQVLYTATNPYVSYKEIETTNAPANFYLSVFKKQGEEDFNVFPILPPKIAPDSNAERFLTAIEGYYPHYTSVRNWTKIVGDILESPKEGDLNKDYMFSSLAAHHILESCDALLTVSQKSNDSELNVTFKKEAADRLELTTVYHCKSLPYGDRFTLMFDVDKIGIVVDGQVEWHQFEIGGIKQTAQQPTTIPDGKAAKAKLDAGYAITSLKISVQESLGDYHTILASIDNQLYGFEAKIKLL